MTRGHSAARSSSRSWSGRGGSGQRAGSPRPPRSSTCRSRTRRWRSRSSRCASRPARTSTTSSRSDDGDETVDVFERPEVATRIAALAGVPAEGARVRPVGVEQSNSSVVLDELHVLKLYRRLEAGPNPELEILRALAAERFANAPRLEGALDTPGPPLETALASVTALVPALGDGWALTLDSLSEDASWLPRARLAARRGDRRRCTARWPRTTRIRTSRPRSRAARRSGWSRRRSTRRSRRRLRRCPTTTALGAVAHRSEEIRDLVQELVGVGPAGLAIRTHGDYHLGQVLWSTDGDWVVIDFEGEPARSLPERRRKRSPLRDLAGMTRSFAYAADAALLLKGVETPAGWVERCREAFLEGYLASTDERILPPSRARLRPAARRSSSSRSSCTSSGTRPRNRPDWASIPVVGLLRMLETARMSLPGELDLHLIGEGHHWRLWEVLGAHLARATTRGALRRVGAERPRRVRRRGLEPLERGADLLEPQGRPVSGRARGRAREGTRYKFAVEGVDGVAAEGRPDGRPCEVPPSNALASSTGRATRGRDDAWIARRAATRPARRRRSRLRGPPGLVAAGPRLPRAGPRARRVRHSTSASPTSSCCR